MRVIDLQDEGCTHSKYRLTFIPWDWAALTDGSSQSATCAKSPLVPCKIQGYEDNAKSARAWANALTDD